MKSSNPHGLMECPFCDSFDVQPMRSRNAAGGVITAWAECRACGARGPRVQLPDDQVGTMHGRVVDKWNTRPY